MQELKYQLQKEDYLDWIHWNVGRQNLKKAKIMTAVIFAIFVVVYVGSGIAAGKTPAGVLSSLILVVILGAGMFYIISPKHQERVIWRRSGLKRLEKTAGFPVINLSVRDTRVVMDAPGGVHKEYSYTELNEIEETERLFLLGAADKTWQFVAKTAFTSQEEQREFKAFIEEKIADAKENPEKYRKGKEAAEIGTAAHVADAESTDAARMDAGSTNTESTNTAESGDEWEAEAVKIEPVDTSNMGKIGKMAHIMAAMAAENAEKEPEEETAEEAAEKAAEKAAEDKTVETETAEDGALNATDGNGNTEA